MITKKIKQLIDLEVNKASKHRINGKRLSTFDNSLLRVEKEDLTEHIDSQASGVLYYEIMLQKAKEAKREVQENFERVYAKEYRKSKNFLEGKGKATIKDIENRVNSKDIIKEKKQKLNEWDDIVATLTIWVKSWIAKGFSLTELNRLKYGELDQEKVEKAKRRLKKHI